jgi:hypothetical protein
MLPILVVPQARRVQHPDYVESRRIDERDAKRESIELDERARIINDLDERRDRWRQRCRLSRVITMRHTLQPVRRSKFARTATPYLKSRGAGKIIVIGSGQGHQGTAATSAYASSKAGTWALVQSLAAELVTFNVSVNELLPGNVKTRLYDDTFKQLAAVTPAGTTPLAAKRSHEWLKRPEDVVPLALFMASQPDVGPTAQSFSLMRRF